MSRKRRFFFFSIPKFWCVRAGVGCARWCWMCALEAEDKGEGEDSRLLTLVSDGHQCQQSIERRTG